MLNSNSKNFDQAVMLDIMSKLSNINDIFPLAENSHLITKNHSPSIYTNSISNIIILSFFFPLINNFVL
jgi:hypothetical protein